MASDPKWEGPEVGDNWNACCMVPGMHVSGNFWELTIAGMHGTCNSWCMVPGMHVSGNFWELTLPGIHGTWNSWCMVPGMHGAWYLDA